MGTRRRLVSPTATTAAWSRRDRVRTVSAAGCAKDHRDDEPQSEEAEGVQQRHLTTPARATAPAIPTPHRYLRRAARTVPPTFSLHGRLGPTHTRAIDRSSARTSGTRLTGTRSPDSESTRSTSPVASTSRSSALSTCTITTSPPLAGRRPITGSQSGAIRSDTRIVKPPGPPRPKKITSGGHHRRGSGCRQPSSAAKYGRAPPVRRNRRAWTLEGNECNVTASRRTSDTNPSTAASTFGGERFPRHSPWRRHARRALRLQVVSTSKSLMSKMSKNKRG